MNGYERMLAEQQEEIERLRSEVITFCSLWAAQYARDNGYFDGCLHATHYDILARAGARLDAFTRYVPPELPAPPDDPDPTGTER
jgi:hypothetical protein